MLVFRRTLMVQSMSDGPYVNVEGVNHVDVMGELDGEIHIIHKDDGLISVVDSPGVHDLGITLSGYIRAERVGGDNLVTVIAGGDDGSDPSA